MALDDGPAWFLDEVIARLSGARRGSKREQWYARCPVPGHNDRHQSFAIRPGDTVQIVYRCGKCSDEECREALAALGVPEEHLGAYGTPEYEATRYRRETSMERMRLDAIAGLLHEDLTPAMLRISIQATLEDIAIPAEKKLFIKLATRAGVKSSQRYAAWDWWEAELERTRQSIPGSSDNNVVPTGQAENLSNPQVRPHDQIPETGSRFRKPEDRLSGNRKTAA